MLVVASSIPRSALMPRSPILRCFLRYYMEKKERYLETGDIEDSRKTHVTLLRSVCLRVSTSKERCSHMYGGSVSTLNHHPLSSGLYEEKKLMNSPRLSVLRSKILAKRCECSVLPLLLREARLNLYMGLSLFVTRNAL